MGLADVFRYPHLSDQALAEVWTSGIRPAHLDTCAACGDRALAMSRWLEDVRALGRDDADTVCADDQLALQREAIMRRLAQLDRPSKVISFPAASPLARDVQPGRGISPAWVVAAAAAGLMLGVVSMELSHLIPSRSGQIPTATVASAPVEPTVDDSVLDAVFDGPSLGSMHALDELTPRVADIVLASNR